MSTSPTYERLVTLPVTLDQAVTEDFIDQNGHMNIGDYFRLGTWAPWLRLVEFGMDDDYIPVRGMSFFTVEHHITYLSELRLGERFSVHNGFAGRTGKALHALAAVLDREKERVACLLEVKHVHVSMQTRRATAIPDDIAARLDADIADHPWVAQAATGISLTR